MNLIQQLLHYKNQQDNLVYYNLATTIYQHLKNDQNLTISTIAAASHCAKSTVVKFAKRLGYVGTKDLFSQLKTDFQYWNITQDVDKNQHQNHQNFDLKFKYENYSQLINENLSFIDQHNFNKILKISFLINKQRRIFLIGKGANISIIKIFADYLKELDYAVMYSSNFDNQYHIIKNVGANDLVFYFNFSGLTPEIEELFQITHAEAVSILLTANPQNDLIVNVDYVINLFHNEEVLAEKRNCRISLLFIIMQIINLIKT